MLEGLKGVIEIVTKTQRLYCTFSSTSVTPALKLRRWCLAIVHTLRKHETNDFAALSFQVSEGTALGWRPLPEKFRVFFQISH